MTAERREAASPDLADGKEIPRAGSQVTGDFTPDRFAGPPNVPAVPNANASLPAAFGRYQVQRTLGEGGFGTVYLGHDSQLNRPVAIKVLRSGHGLPQDEGKEALQEARRLARLRHPGIVSVHDVGVQDGQVYIVSDYLDGTDLCRWLQDNRDRKSVV